MGDFIAQLEMLWPLIMSAPWAFVALSAILLVAGWAAGRFMFGERVETLKSRIADRDEKIADYKAKLDGASPDEAAKLIADLERRLAAIEPKSLTGSEYNRLKAALQTVRGAVSIQHDGTSSASKKLHSQIATAFIEAGWMVEMPMVMGISNPPLSGIGITPRPGAKNLEIILQAFRSAGIQFDEKPPLPFAPPWSKGEDADILVTTPATM